MKLQKFVMFVKKRLKKNIWKIKNIAKLEYRECRGAGHNLCILKYCMPKKSYSFS